MWPGESQVSKAQCNRDLSLSLKVNSSEPSMTSATAVYLNVFLESTWFSLIRLPKNPLPQLVVAIPQVLNYWVL